LTEYESAASRPRSSRWAGRALLLAGVGAGMWLLGTAGSTASAEEQPSPGPLVSLASELLAPVPEQIVVPTAEHVVEPLVTPVVERVVSPVVAPVVEHLVAPVVSPVRAVVVDRAEPGLLTRGAGIVPVPASHSVPAPAPVGAVHEPAALGGAQASAPSGAAVIATAADQGAVPGPPADPAQPAIPASLPTSAPVAVPALSASAGSSSADQLPADLSAAARAADACALPRPGGGDRDAAVATPFDPTFSPD
jgi:hypothetical protein